MSNKSDRRKQRQTSYFSKIQTVAKSAIWPFSYIIINQVSLEIIQLGDRRMQKKEETRKKTRHKTGIQIFIKLL